MNTDWNWFFSSFSQSAAALLAIIGAFIISRLIGIDEKVNNLSSAFEELIISYEKIKESLSVRKHAWINRMYFEYDNDDLIKQIRNREFNNLTDAEILKILYDQNSLLYKGDDEAILKKFKELYDKNLPEDESERIPGKIYISKIHYPVLNITPNGLWSRVNQERDNINQLMVEASELTKKFGRHLNNIGSFESSLNTIRNIIWTLIISFPIIVIYPLHFLPMSVDQKPELTFNLVDIFNNSLNLSGILLFLFLLSIEGILIYFLRLIIDMKNRLLNLEQNNLNDYRNIKSYSKYYRD